MEDETVEMAFEAGTVWGIAVVAMFEAIRDADRLRKSCSADMCRGDLSASHWCEYWATRYPRL